MRRGDGSNALAKHFKISYGDLNTRTTDIVLLTTESLSRRTSNLEEGILIKEAVILNRDHLNSRGEGGECQLRGSQFKTTLRGNALEENTYTGVPWGLGRVDLQEWRR